MDIWSYVLLANCVLCAGAFEYTQPAQKSPVDCSKYFNRQNKGPVSDDITKKDQYNINNDADKARANNNPRNLDHCKQYLDRLKNGGTSARAGTSPENPNLPDIPNKPRNMPESSNIPKIPRGNENAALSPQAPPGRSSIPDNDIPPECLEKLRANAGDSNGNPNARFPSVNPSISENPSGNSNNGIPPECIEKMRHADRKPTGHPNPDGGPPGGFGDTQDDRRGINPSDIPPECRDEYNRRFNAQKTPTHKNNDDCPPGYHRKSKPISLEEKTDDYMVIQHHRHSPHKNDKKQKSSAEQISPAEPSLVQKSSKESTADQQSPKESTADQQSPKESTADQQSPKEPTADHQLPKESTSDQQSPNEPTADQQSSKESSAHKLAQQSFAPRPFPQYERQPIQYYERRPSPEIGQPLYQQARIQSADISEEEEFSRRFLQKILEEPRQRTQFLNRKLSNQPGSSRYEDDQPYGLQKRSFPSNANNRKVIIHHDEYSEQPQSRKWSESISIEELLINK